MEALKKHLEFSKVGTKLGASFLSRSRGKDCSIISETKERLQPSVILFS